MRRKKVLRQPLERLLTERATQVLSLAKEEAAAHRHNSASAEHILLGMTQLNAGVALHALATLGVQSQDVSNQLEQQIDYGECLPTGVIMFTPSARHVLHLSRREAFELSHRYVGTEHLLLGLLREGQSAAVHILTSLGVNIHRIRQQIITVLQGPVPPGWN
ncbi:Clp protease N-terminal domain-containing protein [Sinosporangium album]|uniref:Clp protease N-terminal domain-containing protein n=1 Tax=Sinosporangium album TaxID=504805 RepID=UPI000B8A1A87|nr:Clp protease N-terminal domain-containing protein [Sinosporangium album]